MRFTQFFSYQPNLILSDKIIWDVVDIPCERHAFHLLLKSTLTIFRGLHWL